MKIDFDKRLGFTIHDVARLFRYSFDRQSQSIGLTRAQWSVLVHLYRTNGIQQNLLARSMDITPITLARHVDRLEKDGWLERRSDPKDRRIKRIFVKPKADTVIDKLSLLAQDIKAQALQGISSEEEKQFMDVLLRMRDNLSQSDDSAPRS